MGGEANVQLLGVSSKPGRVIEQGFVWAKFIGPIRQMMVSGIKKVDPKPS